MRSCAERSLAAAALVPARTEAALASAVGAVRKIAETIKLPLNSPRCIAISASPLRTRAILGQDAEQNKPCIQLEHALIARALTPMSRRTPDDRRRHAFDHHVHASRLAAGDRSFERRRKLVAASHQLAMAAERFNDPVVAGRQQVTAVGAIRAIFPQLDLVLRVPTRVVAQYDDE